MDVSSIRSGLKGSSRSENYSGCCLPLIKYMKKNNVLALKYRPQNFKDLIGQEVISKTILNAIKLNKTPNAYLLTGIRGVGKTTTARLIAKALNCSTTNNNGVCENEKSCSSCKEISNSNHIDVLEMDAASKTGIDDVREIIESSKYSPTSAKFKIFIIDEVHMLSKQAFNGLLKTLEEPPPSLKFILATTEVRKIPVTILSRCQRYDLKRVEIEKILDHLKKISNLESGKITDDALRLISQASEGSVRDAISLLDRAIIMQNITESGKIDGNDVRNMLGLADKTKLLSLMKEIFEGQEKNAITILKELVENGIDANNFLNDILELIFLFSRKINLGKIEKDIMISETEIKLIDQYSKGLNMIDLGLFWQLTLKTIEDLKISGNENIVLEMYLMQMVHLKKIGKEDSVIEEKQDNNPEIKDSIKFEENKNKVINKEINNKTKNQLKSTFQIKTESLNNSEGKESTKKIELNSLEELIELAKKENEIELRYDLERNVKLVSFSKGKIDISFNEKLNKNFIKLLSEKLLKWTGERWIISLSKSVGTKTIFEKNIAKNKEKINDLERSEVNTKVQKSFPDAKLTDVIE